VEPTDARLEALYREIAAARHELVALLKERARRPVDDVTLAGPDGPVRLSELFGDHDELILSFNMGSHCAYCTLWADEANGVLHHLQRAAAFVVTSPEPPDVQAAFAASRGWRFPMVSHRGTGFAEDQGFAHPTDEGGIALLPGFATYRRTAGGAIERIGMAYYGPGDPYCSVYHFLELLDSGGEGFSPRIDDPPA
jgi:predicted dithiol-disulfide oxidoreductase (DUF899 family)